MSSADKTIVLDGLATEIQWERVALLTTILRLKKQPGHHVWGPTEEELRRDSGLSEEKFNHALAGILHREPWIQHRYS